MTKLEQAQRNYENAQAALSELDTSLMCHVQPILAHYAKKVEQAKKKAFHSEAYYDWVNDNFNLLVGAIVSAKQLGMYDAERMLKELNDLP